MGHNMESIGEFIHKEKNQKKNNMTTGQIDNLIGYSVPRNKSTANFATDDKQIAREARQLKNIHIDQVLERARSVGLLNEGYDAWYAKVMHTIGTSKFDACMVTAMDKSRDPSKPGALFHFLINKEYAIATDPNMPRFNKRAGA